MEKDSRNIYDPNKVDMKMPEDNFLETEPTTTSIPLMPIILFGVILVLIGILGGLLWWGSQFFTTPEVASPTPIATRPTAEENNEPESENAEAAVSTLEAQSTSLELESIEADLINTNLDILDSELNVINQIFNPPVQ